MKNRNLLLTGLVLGALQATAILPFPGVTAKAFAQAQIDAKTRDLLIQKLTQVYLNLAPADASKVGITLRLADLHAERARIDAMKELESGCVTCTAGKDDRLKALAYYQEVLPKVTDSSLGKVLAQVGHLYEMTGNEAQAIATYEQILKEQKAPSAMGEAHLSLGEVFFKRREYAKAKEHYAAVMALPQASSKGLAAYRFAWCEFNDGQLDNAIQGLVKILKSPELLTRNGAPGVVQIDKQFHEEVSRDLATFIARRPVTVADAQLVFEMSPEQARMGNLAFLSNEVERLGQAQAAIALWRFTQEKQSKPQARMEGHIRLAQLQMEQKMRPEAIKDFEAALALWTQLGTCNENDCREMKTRLRKFVVDWNRVEKKSPTAELLSSYRSYLKVFPQEADMNLWAAQVAAELKDYPAALELNHSAARIALKAGKDDKEAASQIEAGLLGAIEVAELSKDTGLLHKAYDAYLADSRDRKKAVDVQYQKAHLLYEKADYAQAAEALRSVALLKEGAVDVKKQAADLSLDALVLLKDDTRLEAWSLEYAKAFPQSAKEFASISRKAVLNQSVQVANSTGDQAWATLSRFDVAGASNEEKAAFYKNKLILAEKLQKFGDAREIVDQMLRVPNLSIEDQQYALTRKAWLAELVLDFDGALVATEKISLANEDGKKWLKLAMYADLASKDPRPYYGQFLKQSKDDDKNVAISAQLVRDSKEPLKEIEKQKAILAKRPEVFAGLYLEIFGQSRDPKTAAEVLKKALATSGLAQTPSGKILARIAFLDEYSALRAKVTAHQLDGSNQKKMAQTIKARIALLEQTEKLAGRAVESGDWTSQLVSLDLLAKQSERFYQEILSLPVPAGLSSEEEQQYLMLLSQQAAPHQLRASDVSKKISEFWANDSALAKLDEALGQERGARRAILVREVQALNEVAPDTKKVQFTAMLEKKEAPQSLPTLAVLEGARQAVRENPMDRTRIEALLSLEKQMGRAAMVAYLEGRLQAMNVAVPATEEKK